MGSLEAVLANLPVQRLGRYPKNGRGATLVFGIADPDCGPPADAYYDGPATPVVYREGLAQPVRAVRAPRRDRE